MITQPTVLILGAGASTNYGYPSGMKLKKDIVTALNRRNTPLFQILLGQNFEEWKIEAFQNELSRSGAASIDSFLEYRAGYINMGKIAITFVLSHCEDMQKIFDDDYWYGYLYRKLNTSFPEFENNKLSIITFNYDRSLEEYLFTVLKNSYGKSDLEVEQVLSLIPIIHVYGQIGFLPWQVGKAGTPSLPKRAYGNTLNTNDLVACSKGIRIIHEENLDQDPVFRRVHNLLTSASKIYFLGFGYHKENLERLKVSNIEGQPTISGTCKGFTELERNAIRLSTNNKVDLSKPSIQNHDIVQFMREFVNFT